MKKKIRYNINAGFGQDNGTYRMQSADIKGILALLKTEKDTLLSYKNLDFFKTDIDKDKLNSMVNTGDKNVMSGIIQCLNTENVFELSNRKYLGSKSNLLSFIGPVIVQNAGKNIESFFDPFAGTGVVSRWMQQYADRVIANDILFSNYLGLKVFLTSSREEVSVLKLKNFITCLNALEPVRGYVFTNFAGTYFTDHNAGKIEAIREEISQLYREKKCTLHEKNALLLSLLYAMDKCANTVGQYDAFLKHIGSAVMTGGKHKIDSNVYKPITLRRPFFFFDNRNKAYQCDANQLANSIKAEVTYLDPPYNHRQYINCYHLLENIMLWDKPITLGKTRKFSRDHLKSDYSRKSKAVKRFAELINSLMCRHIFLSYNSEGIIQDKDICTILKTRGRLEIFEKKYTIFGHGAGVSKKRPVTERLFHVKVEKN
ncbi:MAG: DNA adenine methylase [Spirochaetales bacterium]|nr:DNA adenine methylase [Spirochaetales bacterium]